MEQMQEDFELWVKSRSGNIAKRDGDYLSSMIRYEWLIWQASRQALVVELPAVQIYPSYVDIVDVRDVLDSAGIKWKE